MMGSLKKTVMLILFLLVILFIAGMGIMSSLNLEYSQRAMSDLRLRQIEESFYANMDRIDAHNRLIEKNTADLARLGELLYRLRGRSEYRLQQDLGPALRSRIVDFREAVAGGIWFDPRVFGSDADDRFAAYAYRQNDRIDLRWANDDALGDYPNTEWYRSALPPDWDRMRDRPQPFYWTPAYYNSMLNAAVITLSTFMKDGNGYIVGLATTDWRTDEIIDLVSEVDVTPGSFSFLIDGNNRQLSGLSAQESLVSQSLLDQISGQTFTSYDWPPAELVDSRFRIPMQTRALLSEGREYALFFSRTAAGMIFGICVPRDEIDSVLEPMRESNYRIAFVTGAILLALSAVILYIVAGIMRLLDTLYTDPLTGLPNRARLLQDLNPPGKGTLILLNVDSFREINDFYGDRCGDFVLKGFADNLKAFLKGLPCCSKAELYRMPADEFAVSIRRVMGPAALEDCLNALSAFASACLFNWEGQHVGLNVTIGAADTSSMQEDHKQHGKKPLSLLPFANMALKNARGQSRPYWIYGPALQIREKYEQNLLWAKRLKAALQERRIRPCFQPIYNNSTGEIEKFECLARLLDEDGEVVPPSGFLHIARKLRLHSSITLLMVEQVFEAFRHLPYEFSINLAYEDIANPETTDFIKARLQQYGLARRAVFEILESEIIKNYDKADAFVKEFQGLGCKIAIDDFGSGYSNFEHLLRIKVDLIKIDGSLIRELDTDPDAAVLAEGIVNFARKLNMQTVAEFVHSGSVQRRVTELGIDYSQGYYIGPPVAEIPLAPDTERQVVHFSTRGRGKTPHRK